MKLAQARASLRRNLSGSTTTWGDELLDGAIARAVEDLDRLYPQEKIDGMTLTFNIDDETWDSGTLGSTVTLSNKRMDPKSETVTDTTGATTYVRDTDYTMDYALGTIIALASGSIPGSQADLLITYKILQVYLDVSSLTDLIRVMRVEYPAGQIPAAFQSFYTWGDFVVVTGDVSSQRSMTHQEHAWVYYHAKHSLPSVTVDGSWNPYLDEVIIKGGEAYSLLTKALELRHGAKTRLDNALTSLEGVEAIETQIDTALANTVTQASSASTDLDGIQAYIDNMTSVLATVGSYLASASDAVVDALVQAALAKDRIGDADDDLTAINRRLASVDGLIDNVNDLISSANNASSKANGPLSTVTNQLGEIRTLIEDSDDQLGKIEYAKVQAKAQLVKGETALVSAEHYSEVQADVILNLLDANINEPIDRVASSIVSASSELDAAVAATDKVNIGEIVSEMHRRHADTWLVAARLEYDTWLTWLARVDRRLAQGTSFINKASEFRLQADSYFSEANLIIGEMTAKLSQIAALHVNMDKELEVADGYISEGQNYVGAANAAVGVAGRSIEQANGYIAVTRVRLDTADQDSRLVESYIAASAQYVNMAQAKVAEAVAMQTPVDAILSGVTRKIEVAKVFQLEADRRIRQIELRQTEVDRHVGIANAEVELSNKFEERGIALKVEFMDILMDRAQVRSDTSLASTRQ